MTNGSTRRGFLRAAGAGVALAPALSGSAAAQSSAGKLVFIYDDGYREDYSLTFPIHREFDAPACAAIPSNVVGSSREFLNWSQVEEMVGAGWEVMSHTTDHQVLGAVDVTSAVDAGDTRVYVSETIHARDPAAVEIVDGERQAVSKITGSGEDGNGRYLTLARPVDASFEAGTARLRYTEDVVRSALKNSRAALRKQGFDVTNLVLPYGRYDQRTLDIAAEYYDAIANVERGGINVVGAIDPHRLKRRYFRTDVATEQELATFMDDVAEHDVLGVLGGHSRHPKLTAERIRLALRMAQKRNIEVVTLQDALVDLGVVDAPTPSPTQTTTATAAKNDTSDGGGGSLLDSLFQWLRTLLGALTG